MEGSRMLLQLYSKKIM